MVSPELSFAQAGKGPERVRTFQGIAYSGEEITDQWFWDSIYFDTQGIRFSPERMPVLKDHDSGQILGYTTGLQVVNNRLEVQGVFLNSSEKAQEVIKLADEGYPWQLSVNIKPDEVKNVDKHESILVNGKTVKGPTVVLSRSTIREISFCAVGADRGANATIFSLQQVVFSFVYICFNAPGLSLGLLPESAKKLVKLIDTAIDLGTSKAINNKKNNIVSRD
ncbi:MAG: hypothetical protein LBS60_07290 [Deltaproteobacteria bacterium]|nr:hypothetical protein [Deltaproteobacteria bacterium]